MSAFGLDRAVAADAAAVCELVVARAASLYGRSAFSRAVLESEWSELGLERDVRVVRDGGRVVGYGAVRERGELGRVEGCVHPDWLGRGIGRRVAIELEAEARRHGAGRVRNGVLGADAGGRRLLESRGYGAVRVFREMRIGLAAAPPESRWPDGLGVVAFDGERDARDFHGADEEAFADHWGDTPRGFEWWAKRHLESGRFDPALWCVVRAGPEIVAGSICTSGTYGGGFVHALFTRRGWRGRGVGAAVLRDSFRRLWQAGEHSVGLAVDAASETGAFRLYERAGMVPAVGGVVYEKQLGDAS
jgi:mycothiol synthase